MQAASGQGGVQSELNVTPLIDVVLVLLIIFMVVTPKTDQQVPVAIPQDTPASPAAPSTPPAPLPVIAVAQDGTFSFQGKSVDDSSALKALVATALAASADKVVFLEPHPEAPYEAAMVAMDVARLAGAAHVGWVDPPM